jgi:hypothetical protein
MKNSMDGKLVQDCNYKTQVTYTAQTSQGFISHTIVNSF